MKPIIALALAAFAIQTAAQVTYPSTRTVSDTTVAFGATVPDPYRWLEDTQSPEVKEWYKSQSSLTSKVLGSWGERDQIVSRIKALHLATLFGPPVIRSERMYWSMVPPNQEQPVLKTRLTNSDVETMFVDPNAMDKAGLSLSAYTVSPDGLAVAYFLRQSGTQSFLLQVKSVDGRVVDIPNPSRQPGMNVIAWLSDSSGFYYSAESASTPTPEYTIRLHKLGTPAGADRTILGGGELAGHALTPFSVGDGRHLIVRTWKKMGANRGVILLPMSGDLPDPTKGPVLVDTEKPAHNVPLGVHQGKLIMMTSKDAPAYRIVEVDASFPDSDRWRTLVPEQVAAVDDAAYQEGRIVVSYLRDAASAVSIFDTSGALLKDVVLPSVGTLGGALMANRMAGHVMFHFSSTILPRELWSLSLKTFDLKRVYPEQTAFDSSQFEMVRVFVSARDGTRIPVFIARKKGTLENGSTPYILNAYGGFGVAKSPSFSAQEGAWLEMGGGIAVAAVRGGGEYGRNWHDQGRGLNKINAINDVVDVAQWLVANNHTRQPLLGLQGTSNGGLVVSAALNQNPSLFGAAVNFVGLTDMLRYETAKGVFNWTDEYGTVKDEAEFRNLLSYSPLHQIKAAAAYPPVLVTAAELDDRVPPWHQYKFIATLQNHTGGNGPKLLSVAMGSGHGVGKSLSVLFSEWADSLAFFRMHLRQ